MALFLLVLVLGIVIDQATKIIVQKNNADISIITNQVKIYYTKNDGAAFSMLSGKSWAMAFFIVITVLALILMLFLYIKKSQKTTFYTITFALLISGAVGNLIDRIIFGYVRDFFYVAFFANFNVADALLTIGIIMLFIYYLFLDKEAIFAKKESGDEED